MTQYNRLKRLLKNTANKIKNTRNVIKCEDIEMDRKQVIEYFESVRDCMDDDARLCRELVSQIDYDELFDALINSIDARNLQKALEYLDDKWNLRAKKIFNGEDR